MTEIAFESMRLAAHCEGKMPSPPRDTLPLERLAVVEGGEAGL